MEKTFKMLVINPKNQEQDDNPPDVAAEARVMMEKRPP